MAKKRRKATKAPVDTAALEAQILADLALMKKSGMDAIKAFIKLEKASTGKISEASLVRAAKLLQLLKEVK